MTRRIDRTSTSPPPGMSSLRDTGFRAPLLLIARGRPRYRNTSSSTRSRWPAEGAGGGSCSNSCWYRLPGRVFDKEFGSAVACDSELARNAHVVAHEPERRAPRERRRDPARLHPSVVSRHRRIEKPFAASCPSRERLGRRNSARCTGPGRRLNTDSTHRAGATAIIGSAILAQTSRTPTARTTVAGNR